MRPQVDPEFAALIPPITQEELSQLEENIIAEGCREPLVIWRGILLDGHNRLSICERHNVEYRTVEVELPDRESAMDWIDRNQLGRRNLTPDQIRLIRGRRYNRLKKQHGGDRTGSGSSGQNVHLRTAEALGREHGVDEKTIRRDGKMAALLEEYPDKAQEVIQGATKLSDVVREIKRAEQIDRLEGIKAKTPEPLKGLYDVIVIDPPWPMAKIERDVRPNQAALDYPTMTEEEMRGISIPAAQDCHIWLWTTHRFLPMAFRLLEAWKLKYVCVFVWHKPGGFQPVGLPQFNCEFAVHARRGAPQFVDTKAFNTCFNASRGKHSEKPEEFYATIRRVTAGRRLDMFGRREIDGFDGWGKEA